MDRLNRVMAIIEPEAENQRVLDRVRFLAKGAEFELLMVVADYSQYLVEGYYFSAAELPALRTQYLAERGELLEGLAKPLRKEGLSVTTKAIWAHPPHQGIVQLVEELAPDLVLHHVKRHHALSRMLLTNDDWQLARHCPAPLLLVKDKPWQEPPRILAAVDPMHGRHKPGGLDHKIMDTASFLATELGGDCYAAHAYGEFPLSGLYPKDAESQHREAFERLMADYQVPASHQRLLEEVPEYALRTLEAELPIDLVVMGAVSRSLVADIFIGSTTEKALDFLDCDVLLIRQLAS